MFGELKVKLRNELLFVELSEVYSASKQFTQLRIAFRAKWCRFTRVLLRAVIQACTSL